ncbi:MAG TPA: FHA domain-containing protein [Thermoanaerobaculia bacterium]|nr:FHA domain-containing protein [Thermoanaerobaculia bacterium]
MKVTFGRFDFDSDSRLLLEDGTPVHLPPKAFRFLEILIANAPRALSKEDLCSAIWPDTFVEESNLAGLAADVRAALGDESRRPRFIRTVHGFGYAFCGEISGAAERAKVGSIHFRGEEFDLHRGENILGRDPSADVPVDDATVSRRHARLFVSEEGVTIEDLGSKNGTFIDDQPVTGPSPVTEEQDIVLGDARLTLRLGKRIRSTVTVTRRPRR